MEATVLVPYLESSPERAAAWEWVRGQYESLGFPVIECSSEPWTKSAALREGIKQVETEAVIVADADSWTPGLTEGLSHLEAGVPWVVPHTRVYRLDSDSTHRVLNGARLTTKLKCHRSIYTGRAGGGVAIVRRESMIEVPWDLRFTTWGGADVCWARALKTLVGQPWRGSAPYFHCWHPPDDKSAPNQVLCDRYRAAAGDRGKMRALVDGG